VRGRGGGEIRHQISKQTVLQDAHLQDIPPHTVDADCAPQRLSDWQQGTHEPDWGAGVEAADGGMVLPIQRVHYHPATKDAQVNCQSLSEVAQQPNGSPCCMYITSGGLLCSLNETVHLVIHVQADCVRQSLDVLIAMQTDLSRAHTWL
jgi:hypothetical protein